MYNLAAVLQYRINHSFKTENQFSIDLRYDTIR